MHTTSPKPRRTRRINITLTDAEYESIVRNAGLTGLSRSAYVRAAALNKSIGRKSREEVIRRLLQLCRAIDKSTLDESNKLIAEIRKAINRAAEAAL